MYKLLGSILLAAAAVVFSPSVRAQQTTATPVAAETLQSMLAVEIRAQGFNCDKALRAVRDAKRSRPDRGVWVLKCSNAMYRITRSPDMAAKVDLSDATLSVTEANMTTMACPGARETRDRLLSQVLFDRPAWTFDGETLVVTANNGTLKFAVV